MLLPPVQPRGPLDRYHRAVCGPLAQGPAALIGRSRDLVVAAVDRLGLRPLWRMRTPGELWLSSEPGVLNVSELDDDPVPLAAGERVLIDLRRPGGFRQPSLSSPLAGAARASRFTRPRIPQRFRAAADPAAHGFTRDDLSLIEAMAASGEEPIGSLGYDGPLALLSDAATVSDHFKEEVAVVTNPAIDRDREREQFSLRVLAGRRPRPGRPRACGRCARRCSARARACPGRGWRSTPTWRPTRPNGRWGRRRAGAAGRPPGRRVDPHLALARGCGGCAGSASTATPRWGWPRAACETCTTSRSRSAPARSPSSPT